MEGEGSRSRAVTGSRGLTCAICWASSLDPDKKFPDEGDRGPRREAEEVLAKFRAQILNSAWGEGAAGQDEKGGGFGLGRGVPEVGGSMSGAGLPPPPPRLSKHFSVCLECMALLNKAIDCREKVAKIDARTRSSRSLQEGKEVTLKPDPEEEVDLLGLGGCSEVKEGLILSERRELKRKRRMTRFYLKMKAIAEVILNVSVTISRREYRPCVEVEGEAPVRKLRGEILMVALKLEPNYQPPSFLISESDLNDQHQQNCGSPAEDDEGSEDEASNSVIPKRKQKQNQVQFQNQGAKMIRMGGFKSEENPGNGDLAAVADRPPSPVIPSSSGRILGGTSKRIRKDRRRKPLKCSICDYVGPNLNRHMEIHNPEGKLFRCPKCPNSYFKNRLGIMMHDKVVHKKMKLNIVNTPSVVREYVEVVQSPRQADKKLFKCKLCGNTYTQRYNANFHIRHRCPRYKGNRLNAGKERI